MLREELCKPCKITLYLKPPQLETSTDHLMYNFQDFVNVFFVLRFLMHVFDVT